MVSSLDTRIAVMHTPVTHVPRDEVGLLKDKQSIEVPIRQFRFIEHAVIAWYKDSSDSYACNACNSK